MISKENIHRFKTLFVFLSFLIIAVFLFSVIQKFEGFPTGIDAPHHIMWARSFVENNYPPEFLWKGKNLTPYPIPEVFFALVSIYTGLSLEYLFPIVLVIFIIATILVAGLISKNFWGFKGWILSVFLALGMKFLLEHLPIGTFAEIFGLFVLFLMIYFIMRQKYLLATFCLLIGFLSHPFVILYSSLMLAIFIPFLIWHNKLKIFLHKYKKIIFIFVISLILIAIISLPIFNMTDLMTRISFVKYITSDLFIIKGGHAYSIGEILNKNNFDLLSLLGIIGLIFFVKQPNNFKNFFLIFLIPLFFILIFNHLFFINIEPYRFISYFQLLIIPLIVYGIIKLTNKNPILYTMFLVFILTIALNNITLTTQAIENYSKDKKGKLPKEDKIVMLWMKSNIKTEDKYICSLYKWGHWIPALAQKKVIFGGYEEPFRDNSGCALILKNYNKNKILEEAKKEKLKYVYFNSYYPINKAFLKKENNFSLLYKEKNAAIYKIY